MPSQSEHHVHSMEKIARYLITSTIQALQQRRKIHPGLGYTSSSIYFEPHIAHTLFLRMSVVSLLRQTYATMQRTWPLPSTCRLFLRRYAKSRCRRRLHPRVGVLRRPGQRRSALRTLCAHRASAHSTGRACPSACSLS